MAQLYCNPLEIAYKYQHPLFGKYAYKEAADPTVILFNNKYFLFTSKSIIRTTCSTGTFTRTESLKYTAMLPM